jgi:hypothetical protein
MKWFSAAAAKTFQNSDLSLSASSNMSEVCNFQARQTGGSLDTTSEEASDNRTKLFFIENSVITTVSSSNTPKK